MMTSISNFLKGNFTKKIVKVYIYKGLSTNKYIAVDETDHSILEVKSNKKVSQGQFYKLIFPSASDDQKWIIVDDKSDILQCSPFDCITLSESDTEKYEDVEKSSESNLGTPISLQDAFNIPGKVIIFFKCVVYIFFVKFNLNKRLYITLRLFLASTSK